MAHRGKTGYGTASLKRPYTVRFNLRHIQDVTPQDVYNALDKEIGTIATTKCIASLTNGWYNVTFDNEVDCDQITTYGFDLQDTLIQCEKVSVLNSAVIYIKVPYEMTDEVVINALMQYGMVTNIRRQVYDFDHMIETGVRSCLMKNIKKLIPSFIKVGAFSLPVNYKGQQKTCKICNETQHFARDCPNRGRCFVCGSPNHRAAWHDDTNAKARPHATRENDRDNDIFEDDDHDDNDKPENTNAVDETPSQSAKKNFRKTTETPVEAEDGENENANDDIAKGDDDEHDQNGDEGETPRETEKKETKSTTQQQRPKQQEQPRPKQTYRDVAKKIPEDGKEKQTTHPKPHKDRMTTLKPGTSRESQQKSTTSKNTDTKTQARKRKSRNEEEEVNERKHAKEEEDEQQNMDTQEQELDDGENDEQETNVDDSDDNYVPYVRRGVQRFRLKRGMGARADGGSQVHESRTSSQTSGQSSQKTSSTSIPSSHRGRGRGRTV